jgi:hypothetical protein
MILTPHMLLGAVIASKIEYTPLAIIMAFLSHYFLDLIPHIEYPIDNIENKQWKKSLPDILRVLLDFSFGILLILIFSNNQPAVFICVFSAILPDGFSFLKYFFTNKILKIHNNIHQNKIHFLKTKKFSIFWRILSQILVIFISIVLLSN